MADTTQQLYNELIRLGMGNSRHFGLVREARIRGCQAVNVSHAFKAEENFFLAPEFEAVAMKELRALLKAAPESEKKWFAARGVTPS